MKAFRFTLQALLTLRQRQERFALEEHARALVVRHRAIGQLEAAEHELALAWTDLRRLMEAHPAAGEITRARDHYGLLARRCDDAATALMAAERGLNLSLQGMIDARRQREMVESCQDRQRQTHQNRVVRVENRLLDEMGARRLAPMFAA